MALRLIQVGLGPWGRNWIEEVMDVVPGVTTVAWVDRAPAVRAQMIRDLGLPPARVFASLEEALAIEADAVVAVVPLAAHREVAEQALEAGLHVLVEKPFTPTLADARALLELAAARDRVLMVNQNYRWFPAPRLARRLLRDGAIGRLHGASIDFERRYDATYRYFFLEQPLLSDMAIHHFDTLRFVLDDEPETVWCWGWNEPGSPFRGNPAACATIRFRRGTLVSYRGSWISHGPDTAFGGIWRLNGQDGRITFTYRGSGPTREKLDRVAIERLGARAGQELPDLPLKDRKGALAAFRDWIGTGTPPEGASTATDNLMSLALMLGAIRSAEAGGAAVGVADLLEDPHA